jgi:hypothetical protein
MLEEKKMKKMRMKMFLVFGWAAIGAVLLASCASRIRAVQKTEVLDYKGASFGLPQPEWVIEYEKGGNLNVEKLSLYKDKYCFVVNYNDSSRDFAVAWVNSASGPKQIAQKVSTTVSSSASTMDSGESGGNMESVIRAIAEQLSNASFTGMTKETDFWQIVRNKDTEVVECRAYALWVINKKALDEQVAANIQNIVDNNKAMSAAERAIYADLIAQIRSGGGVNS